MTTASRPSPGLRSLALAWLSWWREVILGWVPPAWLERSRLFLPRVWLTPEPGGIRVGRQAAPGMTPWELGTAPLDQHPRTLLGRGAPRQPRWVLAIPASRAIVKDLSLPAAVRSRLGEVLRFELDRHTPFNTETALFGYEELPSAVAGAVSVRLAAVPRRQVQDWLDVLSRAGVAPDQVIVRIDPVGSAAIPLLWHPLRDKRARRPVLWALAVTVVLVVALLLVPLLAKRGVMQELDRRHAAILPEAQAVAAIDREREALLERLNEPLRERESRRRIVDILRDLTETIPEQGHIYSLRIEDGDLRIDGETTTATALIEPLEALPSLQEVRFLSPTSRVLDQRERFQIGARIAAPGNGAQ
jgi:general secretion pathway protein L